MCGKNETAFHLAWLLIVLLIGGTSGGCGSKGDESLESPAIESNAEESPVASNNPLGNTNWRLVEIQSMDDAAGTTKPDDPAKYTMRLNADGTVNMRLNCNRANGSYTVEPSSDPSNGRFEFSPLAMTRALCPPPSLDEEIAGQAQWIRGYLLRDGKLYLSLMADGGIYAWEPDNDVAFLTEPDPELEAAILKATPDYNKEAVELGTGQARYIYGKVDLNGDGKEEVLAYPLGSIFCGTGGCNLLLFTTGEEGYKLINNFPITRLPLIVSDNKTNGWNDFFKLETGGGAPSSYLKYTFDGKSYVEQERLPVDPEPEGRKYLAGEFTFEDGIPLEPKN